MIKVCHITSVHKQFDTRIFIKECCSLAKNGFDTKLLVLNGKSCIKDNVEIISVNVLLKNRFTRIFVASKQILSKAIEINADVYHIHDPELLRIALKLKKKTGSKIIYDSHEDLPKQILDKHWIPMTFRKMLSKWIHRYETKKVLKIDGLISVTPLICARFQPFAKNVEMIANYPIEAEFDKKDFQGIIKREKQICYIGGLFPIRGIREIILALEFTDAKLVLAGEFLTPEFEAELRTLNNWDRIEFLGMVDRKKIAEILFESHIGIVTLHPTESFKESIPIKMFEYMLAGLPVISSNFKLWEKYVIENNCGLMVDPLDPKEIAEKINFLLNNENLALEMGENALQTVKKHYTWKSQEDKLINFYNKIIND